MDLSDFGKETIRRALSREIDLENSFKNYHVPGVDYVCLGRTPEETWKIYRIDLRRSKPNKYGWLALPHNHAYSFNTLVVGGTLKHIVFQEDFDAFYEKSWLRSRYLRTPDGVEITPEGWCDLVIDGKRTDCYGTTERQSWYTCDPDDIHTIMPMPLDPVYMILWQHETQRESTNVWTTEPGGFSVDGSCYAPLARSNAEAIRKKALDLLDS